MITALIKRIFPVVCLLLPLSGIQGEQIPFPTTSPLIRFFAGDKTNVSIEHAEVRSLAEAEFAEAITVIFSTTPEYNSNYLLLSIRVDAMKIERGQRLTGWLRVDEGTAEMLNIRLGVSLVFPLTLNAAGTHPITADIPLKVISQDGDWVFFSSDDLTEMIEKAAARSDIDAEYATIRAWLIHIMSHDRAPLGEHQLKLTVRDIQIQ